MRTDFELIISLFAYDPETGIVTCKPRYFHESLTPRQKQWNTRFLNKAIGYISDNGYVRIGMPNGRFVYAHQVAFAVMTGSIPEEIDHKDVNPLNNTWLNLREALHSENVKNSFKRVRNKSGLKGVSWSKRNSSWRMDIKANGEKHFSHHETKELAYSAYCEMSEKLHKDFGNVK